MRSCIVSGVNQGYNNHTILDPKEALKAANVALGFIKKKLQYASYPGKVIYKQSWGCPKNGEAIVALVSSEHNPQELVQWAQGVKDALKQSTLTLAIYEDDSNCGERSRGFNAELCSIELEKLCEIWQKTAENYYDSVNEIFVAAAFYQIDDKIHIQGEVRPFFKPFDTEKGRQLWQDAAKRVAESVSEQLGIELELRFDDVGIIYLKNEVQHRNNSSSSFFTCIKSETNHSIIENTNASLVNQL